jgi:hypothetical protein
MSHNVAHIRNGVVENVSVFAEAPAENNIDSQGLELVVIDSAPVGIGWEYANGTFSNPDFNYVWSVSQGKIDLVQPVQDEEESEEIPE